MTDFKAKMHQIRFRLGIRTRPHWGAYSAPPDLLAASKGPTSKGREGMKGEGEGRDRKGRGGGKGREEKGRGGAPHKCWNSGPQLLCYARAPSYFATLLPTWYTAHYWLRRQWT